MSELSLRLDGVSKRYATHDGGLTALDRVDLTIAPGEFVCLVGASGSGKSTLLNIIAGLEVPTTGEVTLGDSAIAGPSAERAVVFQSDSAFPWLTVAGNLEYGLRAAHVGRADRARVVTELVEQLGLAQFRDAFPRELSGGMRKRIDIGRAYAVDPEILLMDEPFGALDVITREAMQLELLKLWYERRKTVVFITHDIDEAIFLADRVVMLSPRPGRVKKIVDVPFPRPRDMELRESDAFYALRTALRREMEA